MVDGGSGTHPASTCITDPAQTTVTTTGMTTTIAAQCCDDSAKDSDPRQGCRRFPTDQPISTDENCVAGIPPREYTFAQAAQLCLDMGLDLCDRSCKGFGCGYNKFVSS